MSSRGFLKKRKAVKEALKQLGFYDWFDGTYSAPDITLQDQIIALCNYLGVVITKSLRVVAVKQKKEK